MEHRIENIVRLMRTDKGMQCGNCYFNSKQIKRTFLPNNCPCTNCEGSYYVKYTALIPVNEVHIPGAEVKGYVFTDDPVKQFTLTPPHDYDRQELIDYLDANNIKWEEN